jgi:hypothetical protein
MQVGKVGLMILDWKFKKSLNPTKRKLAQVRDCNLNHITRSKGRWEQPTHKAYSYWRRMEGTHSCGGSTSSYGRRLLMTIDAISGPTLQLQRQNKNTHTLLKHPDKWRCLALPTIPGKDISGIDVKSDLTTSCSQKNTKHKTSTIVAGFWPRAE